jgi:hypothetical protein
MHGWIVMVLQQLLCTPLCSAFGAHSFPSHGSGESDFSKYIIDAFVQCIDCTFLSIPLPLLLHSVARTPLRSTGTFRTLRRRNAFALNSSAPSNLVCTQRAENGSTCHTRSLRESIPARFPTIHTSVHGDVSLVWLRH